MTTAACWRCSGWSMAGWITRICACRPMGVSCSIRIGFRFWRVGCRAVAGGRPRRRRCPSVTARCCICWRRYRSWRCRGGRRNSWGALGGGSGGVCRGREWADAPVRDRRCAGSRPGAAGGAGGDSGRGTGSGGEEGADAPRGGGCHGLCPAGSGRAGGGVVGDRREAGEGAG